VLSKNKFYNKVQILSVTTVSRVRRLIPEKALPEFCSAHSVHTSGAFAFITSMSCVCIRYHLVATGLARVWGKSTRADILAPARAGGEEHFLKTNDAQDIGIHSFIPKNSSVITASGGAAKKSKTNNSADCLERIQAGGGSQQ
jgi:hypothetical protein